MTTKILTGAYAAGYTLSAGYDRLTVAQSAEIMGATGAAGAYGRSQGGPGGPGGAGLTVGFAAAVRNAGTIVGGAGGVGGDTPYSNPGAGGTGGVGVALAGGAKFTIRGGAIAGGAGGEGGRPGGDPHNSPGYNGAGGTAVYLAGRAMLNNIAGAITGGAGGAAQFGGQGQGHTGAAGGGGVVLAGSGSVGNAGVITGGAAGGGFSGVYSGGIGGVGGAALVSDAAVTLVNKGSMVGGAGGAGGLTFDKYDTGGAGGAGGAGALMTGGGSLINTGSIVGGLGGVGGTVGNGGTQQGASGAQGVGVMLNGGGMLINGAAHQAGAQIIGAVGVEVGSAGATTIVNFGTIKGTAGTSVQLAQAADRLVVEAGSTFVGAVTGGGGTLELARASGTITGLAGGQGNLTGPEALSFSGFGGFAMDKGGTWTLSGALAGTIDNAGVLAATGPGASLQGAVTNDGVLETNAAKATLTVSGAVTGSGSALIAGGTLDFAATFSQNVRFTTGAGELELAVSRGYAATISGFSTSGGTKLDLLDIAYARNNTTASFAGNAAGGVLTVTDGSHTAQIRLKGDYLGDTFAATSDSQGGTLVTASIAAAPSIHAFASAMAGMNTAADAGFAAQAPHGYERTPMMLAHPLA
jgi:hypothetical protein